MKRIMGFFLVLVMFIGCLPLNPIARVSYAGGIIKIDEKNFPDELFRFYIYGNYDTDRDEWLSQDEINKITELNLDFNDDDDDFGGKITSLEVIKYFGNLKKLSCANNKLENLDVSHNPKLTELDCSNNKLTRLNVSHNPELTKLNCRSNNLTSLDVRNSPNLTEFWCGNQQYDITVNGLGEFKYSNFPGSFDLRRVIINSGATYRPKYLQLWDNDIKEVTYRYRANDDREMYVKLNVHRKFDPDYVESMIVKTQPTKLSYTEGDRLDLTRLVVTLKDKQGLKEEAKLEEFTRYGIKTDPENRANLTLNNNNKPVTIRKGNAQCETDKLIVKAKVVVPDPANPGQVPTGRVRVTFDAGKDNTIDGTNNRYKVIDVLTGTAWTDAKVKEQIPVSATYKDATKVFDKWNETVPTTGTVVAKEFTAEYKDVVKTGTDPKATTPDGYTRITFDATTDGNINGQRYKVIDVLNGTEWNNEAVKGQIPESAKYKDATKVFDKWSETVPTTGTVEAKTFTANYKVKELVKTGTDPSAQVPDGYTRVTFDAGEGNTIDGTNRYKYIDVLENTPWTDAKVKEQIPASATYKDNTKEFDKWSEAVPTTGTVEAKTFTAEYKVKELVTTGTDPNTPVPVGYTRVTFDAGEGNTIDGTNNRYKVIDVLTGTAWDNTEVTKEFPATAKYKDNTKVFDKWDSTVPTTGNVEAKTFTAEYKAKELVTTGTDPNTPVPVGYTRIIFDAGEDNTINGTNRYKVIDVLNGTKWDNPAVKKEIPASATYKDNTKEFKEWDSTVPDTGEVEEQEFVAIYKAKELVTTGTDPTTPIPNGYTRIIFDATEDGKIEGNRYKVIDVLNGTKWDNPAVKKEIPASATYKDNTKEFKEWDSTVPDTGEVEEQEFVAIYKAKELVTTGTNPTTPIPNGYTRVTFDAGEDNTINGTNNRYKVIDVLTGTAWDNAKVKEQIPLSATYKDATKEFDKWSEAVPTTGTVEAKKFTAEYKAKERVTTGTNPSAPVPVGYTRVTFDAGEGNTIDRTNNRYKVIDVLTGTAWDNPAVKGQIPASATYKDNTKEFDKWSEAVPTTGTVEAKTFTAEYKAKELVTTGTDPNTPVPVGYTRVTFDAGEDNTIDGTNRYKVIDVLTGTKWDNQAVKKEIPTKATYKDNTKEFNKWSEAVPTTGTVETKTFKAEYKAVGGTIPTPTDPKVVGPVDPTDPNDEKPADTSKYWTVTFETEDETKGTVSAKNTVYVLKTETKTLADITAPEVTAKEGYEFDKWEPTLDKSTAINKDLKVKAQFKKVVPVPTPTDPKVVGPVDPTDPNGGKPADASKYYTVTFETEDETKGTVSAKNTVYVLKTETKTLADITAPEVTAKEGYEFDKWEPTLDKNTAIDKDLTVKAHFKKVKEKSYNKKPYNKKSYNKKPQVSNNSKMPKTANSMNIELYTVFMILSGALLVVAFKRKKRVNR